MAAGSAPIFVATPRIEFVQVAVYETTIDGSGTISALFTGGAQGSRVYRVRVKQVSTAPITTAGTIQFYLKKSGGSYQLLHQEEWPQVAITYGGATPTGDVEWVCEVYLCQGDMLGVSANLYSGRTPTPVTLDYWAIGADF